MIRTVLLDVDGVLGDFTSHALAAHKRPDLIVHSGQQEYNLAEVLDMSKDDFWQVVDNHAFWRSVPMYPGAPGFVARLNDVCYKWNVKFRYCTSGQGSSCFPAARTAWLRHLNMKANCDVKAILVNDHSDKLLLASQGVLFIEDNDCVIDAVREQGAEVVRIPQPWNRGFPETMYPPDYDSLLNNVIRRFKDGVENQNYNGTLDLVGYGLPGKSVDRGLWDTGVLPADRNDGVCAVHGAAGI